MSRQALLEALTKHLYGREQMTPAAAAMRAGEVLFIIEQMAGHACDLCDRGEHSTCDVTNRRASGNCGCASRRHTSDDASSQTPEPLTLRSWCGRYTPHGEHDGCLGWGDGRVGVEGQS